MIQSIEVAGLGNALVKLRRKALHGTEIIIGTTISRNQDFLLWIDLQAL